MWHKITAFYLEKPLAPVYLDKGFRYCSIIHDNTSSSKTSSGCDNSNGIPFNVRIPLFNGAEMALPLFQVVHIERIIRFLTNRD